MFVDRATIRVKGGAGGAGAEAFRREKGVPRGGPSGGDGGRGGDVVLVVNPQMDTLLDYRYRTRYRAGRAGHGKGGNRKGADGENLVLPVPAGTVVRDADAGSRLGELLAPADRLLVARGGRGGRGNARFATATRQAPRRWEPGEWGEERRIELELKLIADVGLVGEPNAGKSSLLAAVSAARPKVADYPFTTVEPCLGVAQLGGGRTFVMADIPGLVEGAHTGRGLGTQFLRHIERSRTLALLVPVDASDPAAVYELLRSELAAHNPALARVPHCVVMSKADLVSSGRRAVDLVAPEAWAVFTVSAVSGEGLDQLKERLWAHLRAVRAMEPQPDEPEPFPELEKWTP